MNDDLSKSILITGAARRIGRAMALDLAALGWTVGVHCHTSVDDAAEVVEAIRDTGGQGAVIEADLGDEAAVGGLIGQAADAVGPLTALINNASLFERDTAETAGLALWDAHMQVNLRAPFVLSQAFAAQLAEGADGNIINIIDQRVWNLTPDFTSYTVSKSGLWTLTRTLAMAMAPRIRVNAIGPGPTLASSRQTDAQFEKQWRQVPLERPVDVGEISNAVGFLLDSPSVTGQMIALDGGEHLGWAQPVPGTTPHE